MNFSLIRSSSLRNHLHIFTCECVWNKGNLLFGHCSDYLSDTEETHWMLQSGLYSDSSFYRCMVSLFKFIYSKKLSLFKCHEKKRIISRKKKKKTKKLSNIYCFVHLTHFTLLPFQLFSSVFTSVFVFSDSSYFNFYCPQHGQCCIKTIK